MPEPAPGKVLLTGQGLDYITAAFAGVSVTLKTKLYDLVIV